MDRAIVGVAMTTTRRKPTWQQLCREHAVDMAHAKAVKRLAVELFHATRPWHQLPDSLLPILDVGALLHNVGLQDDPPNHHTRGREIILERGLAHFDLQQTAMIACLVVFHRKRARAGREPLFELIPTEQWLPTLLLAAILRVADGLDYSQDGAMRIVSARECSSGIALIASGEESADAAGNIARANRKADLWNATADIPIAVYSDDDAPASRVWLTPSHSIGEAAPRMLRFYFEQLAAHAGEGSAHTVTDIHQARVATRRMRSALKVFSEAFPPEEIEPFTADLRWIAGLLGDVRDDDVFRSAVEKAAATLSLSNEGTVVRLLAETGRERDAHLALLRSGLHSQRFQELLRSLPPCLAALENREVPSPTLGDRAPRLLRRQWKRVRRWRDHIAERPEPETLHELRIAIKRLRYTADFLRGLYGDGLDELLSDCTALQDMLGEIHDVDVFTARLDAHAPASAEDLRVVHALVVHWLREQAALRGEFAHRWCEFAGRTAHRRLLSVFADGMLSS